MTRPLHLGAPATMHAPPKFLTFTGADDETDIDRMIALGQYYPIEWGVLLSPSRQGSHARYPSVATVRALLKRVRRLSLHLCGGYSRAVLRGEPVADVLLDVIGDRFIPATVKRAQINSGNKVDPWVVSSALPAWVKGIAQTRDRAFPAGGPIDWLFDASGGAGKRPSAWPWHPGAGRLVGYAGGIAPENVLETIAAIKPTGPYWLDMETGIRTDDRFDLDKVQAVCETLYGGGCAGLAMRTEAVLS